MTIDTTTTAVVPAQLRVSAGPVEGGGYALVRFEGPLGNRQLAELESAVSRVYAYLPNYAFLVSLPAGARPADAARAAGAAWGGPFHPAYKLSPAIEVLEERAAETERYQILLHLYPDADLEGVRDRLEAVGAGSVVGLRAGGRFSRLRLLMTAAELSALKEDLARTPEIFWIDVEARRVLLNDTTIWVGQSGLDGGQATPLFDLGLYGQGQIVGVVDTGIDPDMCFFRDPSAGLPPRNECDGGTVVDNSQRKVIAVDFLASGECAGGISSSEWDTHDHGTHVAGTAAGDDFANPLIHDPADGMATGAKLVIQDGGFATDNCADLPGLGCPVVDLNPIFQQAYSQGARLHTNSWGDRENFLPHNIYSAGSEDADEFTWNHKDFVLLFAAGNSGSSSGTVGSPSTAKNVLSIGATQRGSSADSMASFSSCGPTEDGRIKPDVTSPGVSIISANNDQNTGSNNCDTRSMSGTSMASPAAAGLSALVRQYYADGWYPAGTPSAGTSFVPSSALVRATVVNSALDMANVPAIPSDCQGWGRILLDDALHFEGENRRLWVRDEDPGFSGPASESHELEVLAGEPLKVTLAWTDFPSTPAAQTNLVNDLDLAVSGPDGTFLGNVFSNGESTTGGSPDRLNNLEQVLVKSPTAGMYIVTVTAFNVPQGPQPWALVVNGDVIQAEIFSDGFESGDLSAWSLAVP